MSNSIAKLTLDDLKGKIFIIPFYQRGYRWTKNEASKLFSDLLEFSRSKETEYCLQPIVLQSVDVVSSERKDFPVHTGKECLRVVDGQQRLTTIAILMSELGVQKEWDIYYVSEGKTLSEILTTHSDCGLINDYFRDEVRRSFQSRSESDKKELATLFGTSGKSVAFLRYNVLQDDGDPEGHDAFLRLNDGKTPLTSSELIRALYMVNASGLDEQERVEISKEWEIIETTLREEQFWLMFNSEGLSDTPTRMDLLFALVMGVNLKDAKANPLVVFEKLDSQDWDLSKIWREVLRCFWWMKSCYSDVELFNLLCWIRSCTENSAKTIYDNWRKYPTPEDFKNRVCTLIQEKFKNRNSLDMYDYSCDKTELRHLFLLLNVLDCNYNKERFRFDLYEKEKWDIEHIDSQTPNNLSEPKAQAEWLLALYKELPEAFKQEFRECFEDFDENNVSVPIEGFEEKKEKILKLWESSSEIVGQDKDRIGNLALLNASINRSYKNAVFPAKRKVLKESIVSGEHYVPPCTAKAFMKFYTESPSKITYWQKEDFDAYSHQMRNYFSEFLSSVNIPQKKENSDSQYRGQDFLGDRQYRLTTMAQEYVIPENRFAGKVSFEEFMDKYRVVIPKIQRLYVQGRQDANGKKCLTSFASQLVEAVACDPSSQHPLLLDFIYGIDCEGGTVFKPLDGQQRLTTLLLLGWLCAKSKSGWTFRYEARRVAECFIEELLKHEPPTTTRPEDFAQKIKESKKGYLTICSDAIKKADWFLSAWTEDDGVSGMLEMLDSLYSKLISKESLEYDLSRISFFVNYLNASEESYDQIFLKMNSRGKGLTNWECVKAVLDKNVEEEYRSSWQENLNNKWQELLWKKLKEKRVDDLDSKMLEVVELALKCVGYEGKAADTFQLSSWFENKENRERRKEFYDLCSIFFSSLEEVKDNERNVLTTALNPSWSESDGPQWPDFTKDYYKPLLAYYAASQSIDADWMRVVWNIVENCGLSGSNFPSAYKLVKELSCHKNSILDFLASQGEASNVKIQSNFAPDQVGEECEKARRIKREEDGGVWLKVLLDLEKHPLLHGRIQALLFSGNFANPWEESLDRFRKRCASFFALTKNLSEKDWCLNVCAALLACGDYTCCTSAYNWRFVVDEESLQFYLHERYKGQEDSFRKVLFDLLSNASNVEDCKEMCKGFVDRDENVSDWRYYFIKYREDFLVGTGYYAWEYGAFSCRKIDGKDLRSSHSNPYMVKAGIPPSYIRDFKAYDRDGLISIEIKEDKACVILVVTFNDKELTFQWNKDCDFVEWIKRKRPEWLQIGESAVNSNG